MIPQAEGLESLRRALREHGAESARMQGHLMDSRREIERLRERIQKLEAFARWFESNEFLALLVGGGTRRILREKAAEAVGKKSPA
jgi:hypothetical protein